MAAVGRASRRHGGLAAHEGVHGERVHVATTGLLGERVSWYVHVSLLQRLAEAEPPSLLSKVRMLARCLFFLSKSRQPWHGRRREEDRSLFHTPALRGHRLKSLPKRNPQTCPRRPCLQRARIPRRSYLSWALVQTSRRSFFRRARLVANQQRSCSFQIFIQFQLCLPSTYTRSQIPSVLV